MIRATAKKSRRRPPRKPKQPKRRRLHASPKERDATKRSRVVAASRRPTDAASAVTRAPIVADATTEIAATTAGVVTAMTSSADAIVAMLALTGAATETTADPAKSVPIGVASVGSATSDACRPSASARLSSSRSRRMMSESHRRNRKQVRAIFIL